MSAQWYLYRAEQRYGPYAWQDLVAFTQSDNLAPNDLLWGPAASEWVRADQFPELFPPPALSAPATPAARKRRLWPAVALVSVALLLTAVAAYWLWGRGNPEPSPYEPLQTSLTAIEGQAVALPGGGQVLIPDGSLAAGAQVSGHPAPVPLLPEGIEPLGSAVEIKADAQPTDPVVLRLPLPEGVDEGGDLVIVRVQADGSTTLLMTERDGGELLAATPGFSVFVIGQLLNERETMVVGRRTLVPGASATYHVLANPGTSVGAGWQLSGRNTGGAALIQQSDSAATVVAGSEGKFWLRYERLNLLSGTRWFGAVYVEVSDRHPSADATMLVSATTDAPITYAGEQVSFGLSVQGQFEPPVTWSWDYGNGVKGSAEVASGALFAPPLASYTEIGKVYHPQFTARDSAGQSVSDSLSIRVLAEPLVLHLDGPRQLALHNGVAYGEYTANAGGDLTGPYEWTWRRLPAARQALSDRAEQGHTVRGMAFDEPGEHRIEVMVRDALKREARAALPVLVTGGPPLSAGLADLPPTARPNEPVAATVWIEGGALIVSGKRAGYTVHIDWDDGSPPTEQRDLGADRSALQGATLPVSHAWAEAKTYTVRLTVRDATGSSVEQQHEIEISDAPEPTVVAPSENRAPTAEDITTSTKGQVPLAITLKGQDEGGDKLQFKFTKPAHGSLAGRAPFLTYTAAASYDGQDSFTYTVSDGQAESAAATVRIDVSAWRAWVLDGAPTINASGKRLEYIGGGPQLDFFGEERFAGMFTVYSVSETAISVEDRWVDHGFQAYHVTITSAFDAPARELAFGEAVTLACTFSGSGEVTEGSPGARFQYTADRQHPGIITPAQPLGYYPWAPEGAGPATMSWTLTPPTPRGADDVLEIYAGWWNCEMCNVTWRYRPE